MNRVSFSLIVTVLIFNSLIGFSQNIGINSTGAAPDNSALLDVSSTNKGMLMPRVALTSAADVATIASPALSLLVYNTATAGVAPNDVVPGFYYWNGTKWTALTTSGGSVTANNGLTATGSNVQLGGTLIANTTINQGTNDLTFNSTGAGSTIIGGTLETQGGVYANVRTMTSVPLANSWLPTDYIVSIKVSGPQFITLPDPALNPGRVLFVRNASVQAGVSGTYTYIVNVPVNNTSILASRGQMLISDGVNWLVVAGL